MAQEVYEGLVTRTTCRVCDSAALTPVMDLGETCIAGVFAAPNRPRPPEPRLPLELVRCDPERDSCGCGLLQLRHTVPASTLYKSYWYRSGINRTMTDNLHEIVREAVDLVGGLAPGELVIDVGCNDGTLLDGYRRLTTGVTCLGVDPSDITRYAVEKGHEVIRDFFSTAAVQARHPGRTARVITSIAMFYDLEQPVAFVEDIARSLAQDGVWVAEFSYLPTMLRNNSFDTICHEHLEYYSLAVFETLLGPAGLRVVRAQLNDVNGGSIRLFVGHAGALGATTADQAGLEAIRSSERAMGLHRAGTYEAFARRTMRVKSELLQLLRRLKSDGKTIHAYGASTKGNTILQYVGIDSSLIDCVADRNPDKWGSETIGTHIPIVSEEESRAREPDYFLALPWHFLEEFLQRESAFLARGGRFIVPLPDVGVLA